MPGPRSRTEKLAPSVSACHVISTRVPAGVWRTALKIRLEKALCSASSSAHEPDRRIGRETNVVVLFAAQRLGGGYDLFQYLGNRYRRIGPWPVRHFKARQNQQVVDQCLHALDLQVHVMNRRAPVGFSITASPRASRYPRKTVSGCSQFV